MISALSSNSMDNPFEKNIQTNSAEKDNEVSIYDVNIPLGLDNKIDVFLEFIKHGNQEKALLAYEQLINRMTAEYKSSLEALGVDFEIDDSILEDVALSKIQDRLWESTGVSLNEFIINNSDELSDVHKQQELFA